MTTPNLIALCSLVNAIALRVAAGGEPPANTAEGATGDPTPPPDLDLNGESDTGWLTPAGLLQQDDCGEDERGYYGVCVVHTRAEAMAAWTDAVRDAAPVVVSDDIRALVKEVLRRAGTPLRSLSAAEDRESALAYAAPILAREIQRLQTTDLVRVQAERDAALRREADALATVAAHSREIIRARMERTTAPPDVDGATGRFLPRLPEPPQERDGSRHYQRSRHPWAFLPATLTRKQVWDAGAAYGYAQARAEISRLQRLLAKDAP